MENTERLPLISIIVPVYNVKDYITKCLDSICGQTYKNLEIILVDDGSTDNSGKICDAYALNDQRIEVLHQPNAGQSAARNMALDIAQGEYLGFVDSDDWLEKDMYELLYRLLKKENADIAVCAHYIEAGGKTKVRYASEDIISFSHTEAMRALVEDKRIRNYVWDKLYKRSLFEGVRFPLNRIFEDLAVSYLIFHQAEKVVMQETPKYHYVVREGSAMQSKYNPLKEHNLFQSVYEQVRFVLERGIWEKAPIYLLRRGIHLIDHTMMLKPSAFTNEIVKDVLAKMHEFDNVSYSQLGFSLSLKRYLIYHHRTFYRKIYCLIRSVFKSKRHKY